MLQNHSSAESQGRKMIHNTTQQQSQMQLSLPIPQPLPDIVLVHDRKYEEEDVCVQTHYNNHIFFLWGVPRWSHVTVGVWSRDRNTVHRHKTGYQHQCNSVCVHMCVHVYTCKHAPCDMWRWEEGVGWESHTNPVMARMTMEGYRATIKKKKANGGP